MTSGHDSAQSRPRDQWPDTTLDRPSAPARSTASPHRFDPRRGRARPRGDAELGLGRGQGSVSAGL